jgi:hypothetical protein
MLGTALIAIIVLIAATWLLIDIFNILDAHEAEINKLNKEILDLKNERLPAWVDTSQI